MAGRAPDARTPAAEPLGSLDALVKALRALPGVGPRAAQRMALHLLQYDRDGARALSTALAAAVEAVHHCERCNTFTEGSVCALCRSPRRDATQLCVVETPSDLLMVEQTQAFAGMYYVLMGRLSPLAGIGSREIRLDRLLKRALDGAVRQVILATNLTHEGEATAHLQTGEQKLLNLETRPGDRKAMDAVFGAMHSLKGVCGFLGLASAQELAHESESVIDRARRREEGLRREECDGFLRVVDVFSAIVNLVMLHAKEPGGPLPKAPEAYYAVREELLSLAAHAGERIAAPKAASAAPAGGTKIMEASAPVSRTASATVSKMGREARLPSGRLISLPSGSLSNFWPPLPGVTPPTKLVPYSMQRAV